MFLEDRRARTVHVPAHQHIDGLGDLRRNIRNIATRLITSAAVVATKAVSKAATVPAQCWCTWWICRRPGCVRTAPWRLSLSALCCGGTHRCSAPLQHGGDGPFSGIPKNHQIQKQGLNKPLFVLNKDVFNPPSEIQHLHNYSSPHLNLSSTASQHSITVDRSIATWYILVLDEQWTEQVSVLCRTLL